LALAAGSVSAAEPGSGKLLEAMLAGPMAEVHEIVFDVRESVRRHYYENFGHSVFPRDQFPLPPCGPAEPGTPLFGRGGRLCRLNLRTGKLTVLVDDPQGGVRDPQVHYGGRKILFSYRKGAEQHYNLYEIGIDGSGLAQLTDGPFDDVEPTYSYAWKRLAEVLRRQWNVISGTPESPPESPQQGDSVGQMLPALWRI
jgi:hypothetical protein